MAKRYYAVSSGRQVGVFKSEKTYRESVVGYKGSKGKSFKCRSEAQRWLNEELYKQKNSTPQPRKYYAVKKGHRVGVFTNIEPYRNALKGFKGSEGKSFKSKEGALKWLKGEASEDNRPSFNFIATDASAKRTNRKKLQFRFQVYDTQSEEVLLRSDFLNGCNNIGEALGVVEAMKYLYEKNDQKTVIFTDSEYAIKHIVENGFIKYYIENPKGKDRMTNKIVLEANRFLRRMRDEGFKFDIRKWESNLWGNVPAHFNISKTHGLKTKYVENYNEPKSINLKVDNRIKTPKVDFSANVKVIKLERRVQRQKDIKFH